MKYAIINEKGGWFENLVIWDGNLETWQPPEGTIAKRIAEVDVTALPERPQE
jgi:hypothetical protein